MHLQDDSNLDTLTLLLLLLRQGTAITHIIAGCCRSQCMITLITVVLNSLVVAAVQACMPMPNS